MQKTTKEMEDGHENGTKLDLFESNQVRFTFKFFGINFELDKKKFFFFEKLDSINTHTYIIYKIAIKNK